MIIFEMSFKNLYFINFKLNFLVFGVFKSIFYNYFNIFAMDSIDNTKYLID